MDLHHLIYPGDNQTENQNNTAQVAPSANGQGAPEGHGHPGPPGQHPPQGPPGPPTPRDSKGETEKQGLGLGGQVTEVTATVEKPAEEENATEWSKGKVEKVTVKEKFQAGDRPGVKLDYHSGFGSSIRKWDCSSEGAWLKTRSLLNDFNYVYVKEINKLDCRRCGPAGGHRALGSSHQWNQGLRGDILYRECREVARLLCWPLYAAMVDSFFYGMLCPALCDQEDLPRNSFGGS